MRIARNRHGSSKLPKIPERDLRSGNTDRQGHGNAQHRTAVVKRRRETGRQLVPDLFEELNFGPLMAGG